MPENVKSVAVTPRILIAGRDEQQRQWLRHHLQTLWPDADPPSLDLEDFERQRDSITRRKYDVVLLCASFNAGANGSSEGTDWLRLLRRQRLLPPLITVAADGNAADGGAAGD